MCFKYFSKNNIWISYKHYDNDIDLFGYQPVKTSTDNVTCKYILLLVIRKVNVYNAKQDHIIRRLKIL